MSIVCTRISLVCHLYVTRMYPYSIRMSFACHPYVTRISLVCHPYVTRMYSYVIRMSLVCSLCHPYVTRMYSYAIRMSLVCTRMSPVWHSYVFLPWTAVRFIHYWYHFQNNAWNKTSIKFRPVWYICPHWYMCHEIRNEQILSLFTPTFGETWKKTSNHNILFLRLAFFEKVKSVYEISKIAILTVFRIGFFGAAEGWGGRGGGGGRVTIRASSSKKIYHTHPTVMKLDTPLGFCCHQHFFNENP